MQQVLHNLAEYVQKQSEEARRYKRTVADEEGMEPFYWEAFGRQRAYEDILKRISIFVNH